ncbi:hypothetical protein C8F04DRAFT_1148506 [Mycena alexandri]|uniref:F-box domain-containing protein n=1 Tax=Mycena alexandri TaxID=1745969 RepID=A0AAD6WNG0_9AGAR|nr:hypothetical protein C8F04DRAFT_1148506 [Mycena alexandri]
MSSPFASKLGTNYCPRDEEILEIQSLLTEPCLRLKSLDDEIAALQRTIVTLSEERDALGAYVDAHRALTSPLRRLPFDIIQEIFMACLPTHRNCVMNAQEAPVLLGRICSSWRTISRSSPRLWSSLHIVEPTRPYSSPHISHPTFFELKVAQRLEVAKAWLRRSGDCPLSISLESNLDHGMTPPLSPSPAPPNTDLFIAALLPFVRRWQSIRLVVPPLSLETLSHLTEDDVPLLKHLKIVQRPERPHNNTQWNLASVLRAPNLSRFSISGSNMAPSDLPLRWNQLTALSIMGPAWGMGNAQTSELALSILSRCPELRTCKMLVHDAPEGHMGHILAPLSHAIVECHFLNTLDIVCVGAPLHTSGRLLGRLSTPNLRDFRLRGQGEPHATLTADAIVSALAASTRLESISIDSDTFSKATLTAFLRGLPPAVRCLRVTDLFHSWHSSFADGVLDDDVLAAFSPSPDSPNPLCPALQELTITHCHNLTDEAIFRFISFRVPTLKRVDIRFDRDRQVDILPRLQPFVEAGLLATLNYVAPAPMQFSPWQGLPDAPLGSMPWMTPVNFLT